MKRAALLLSLALLGACRASPPERVRAEDYTAFYLWAGVRAPPALDQAEAVYLLAGEVRRDGRYVPLRAVPRAPQREVWLVVRSQTLDWSPAVAERIIADLARWRDAGNRVAGLQVDFDASTKGLDRYAAFLAALRRQVPSDWRLSVTGLMDWSANADPAALAALQGVVDEVVVQSYQGRSTIPGYARYLDRLARLPVPHKVALVEGGEWREPAALRRDPLFRGYVVFLLPD
ncbi:MAG: DUF3142 domain-containing protein [Novosphingobium sp.]